MDLDAAYRQIHANAPNVSTCIAIVLKTSFLYLQLPFGTTPAPEEYMTIKEVSIYLVVNILRRKY